VKLGPLNVFQRLARTWDAVHPYNAGQACRVSGTFLPERVDASWNAAANMLGRAPHCSVHCLSDGDDLSRHFTRELNRPFEGYPFRPFLREISGETWLGVVYQHWVADSFSIRLLMRAWIEQLVAPAKEINRLIRPAQRTATEFSWETLQSLLRRYSDYRHTRKIHTMGPLDYPVRVRRIQWPGLRVAHLLKYARQRNVKLNDLFLASLSEACDRLMPAQSRAGRRNLAVSSIVDLRPRLSREHRSDFGCLLGFNSTACRPFDLQTWDGLLHAVAAQRRPNATGGMWMFFADMVSQWTPPSRVYDFYRKEAPFAGGVSNVNLNGTWFESRHPDFIQEYIRVSPTGPMVPLALNVTTLGESLAMTMTYRANLLNDWTAAEIGQSIARRLTHVAAEAAAGSA
jgi:hypothetical protein